MQKQELPQDFVIILDLLTDGNEGAPALVLAIGRDTVTALQQEGHTIRPVYTGQKGGFLVEVITTAMQFTWNHPDEIIADLSGLVTIFGSVIPTIQKMLQAHEKRVGKAESVANPLKIQIEIDGAPIMVEASDVVQAEAALELARQFHSAHPSAALQATAKSQVKVQGQVPARQGRKRK